MMGASDDLWPRPPESWAEQPLELIEPIDEGRFDWLARFVAALLVLVWLGTALWSARVSILTMDAAARIQLVAALCMPPMLISIPTGVKVFNWVSTMWKGSLTFESPMLWAVAFVILFSIGGFSPSFRHCLPRRCGRSCT